MTNSVVTRTARLKMLRARAEEDYQLPKIEGFAFGSGGVDASGSVITPTESQDALNEELMRKPYDGYKMMESDLKCRYECTLTSGELVGQDISEIALYDSDGDIIAIKNFMAKGKDFDLEMTFQIDDIF